VGNMSQLALSLVGYNAEWVRRRIFACLDRNPNEITQIK
jgi:hypothetical protein